MKKIARRILALLLVVLLIALAYVLITFPPVMRGMGAKVMCSCIFVSGRSPESVIQKELQVFPGLSNMAFDINLVDSTVTAKILWTSSKAIYRKGLGCTLLAQMSEEQLRAQKWITPTSPLPDQDTIPWPTGNLNAHASDMKIDRDRINKAVADAFAEKDPEKPINTHAVVAVYKGKIIAEQYAKGFDRNSILMGWSMTKSITNALIGILVKDGKLSLHEPVGLEEWKDDERSHITLEHLLQASSGLSWSESYFLPGASFHNMFIHSDDKGGYAINRDLEHKPGTFLEYSSGTTNILSVLMRRTIGDEYYHRFPYEKLFYKIGMYHALLEPDASGTFVASSYGYASARDWARFGLLYLNDGVWNGERILPEGWVQYSITPAPAAKRREYGAQIWLNLGEKDNPQNVLFPGLPNEAVIFSGFEENFVVIIPTRSLVVVRLGVTHNDNFSMPDLVNGIISGLPPDRGQNALNDPVAFRKLSEDPRTQRR